MVLELQTGTPTVEGRYVVFTPCASRQVREWCEPHIATWTGGKWIFYDPIYAWIGPLPVVHSTTGEVVEPMRKQREYDL